ncbi:MAG: sigma-54 dependent transcriptional regulator [Planctomycetota bacterium]|nr:sigma-54 dependent transcriptional regulator [Planctomycetota bacterium]
MSMGSILLVEDDLHILKTTAEWLTEVGFTVTSAATLATAKDALYRAHFDVVISDIRLEDGDGFTLLQEAQIVDAKIPVILYTGYGTVETAVEAMRIGAFDFLSKPLMDDELLSAIERAISHGIPGDPIIHERRDSQESSKLQPSVPEPIETDSLQSRDTKMQQIFEVIETIANTKTTVLITGESGTGKSRIAREIHQRSERRDGPFIEVACGALPETLLESELFGHVKGAFTDACSEKDGKFHQAEGGTIFLDEIATASPAMQVKLLRVLQEFQFEKIGGTQTFHADTRVILATNENLSDLVAKGQFREDLFYRINVIHLELPPLRERAVDIPYLADFFLEKLREELGKSVDRFSPEAMQHLETHPLPGNIRELQNIIERAILLGKSNEIQVDDLPEATGYTRSVAADSARSAKSSTRPQTLKEALEGPERSIILNVLNGNNWNRNETADTLGINRTTLYKKMKKLGLEGPRVMSSL